MKRIFSTFIVFGSILTVLAISFASTVKADTALQKCQLRDLTSKSGGQIIDCVLGGYKGVNTQNDTGKSQYWYQEVKLKNGNIVSYGRNMSCFKPDFPISRDCVFIYQIK